jgi:hypothetical protein
VASSSRHRRRIVVASSSLHRHRIVDVVVTSLMSSGYSSMSPSSPLARFIVVIVVVLHRHCVSVVTVARLPHNLDAFRLVVTREDRARTRQSLRSVCTDIGRQAGASS